MSLAVATCVTIPISDCMTRHPFTIGRYESLGKAHALMRENGIRHLPVMDQGALVGVVSRGDLHLLETVAEFSLDAVNVEEAMNPAYVVPTTTPVDQVVDAMVKEQHGGAVVVDARGKIVGIFTTIDALQLLVKRLRS